MEQNSPDPVDETDGDRQKEYDPRPSQGSGLPRGGESWLAAHVERWAFLGAEVVISRRCWGEGFLSDPSAHRGRSASLGRRLGTRVLT